MAQLTITVPDALVPRIITAVTAIHGGDIRYQGLTGAALIKAVMIDKLRDEIINYEAQQSGQSAVRTQAQQSQQDFSAIG